MSRLHIIRYPGVPFEDLVKLFPDIRKLDLDFPMYDNISEIGGFSKLDYVHFAGGITAEEKNTYYLYPTCEVDEQANYR